MGIWGAIIPAAISAASSLYASSQQNKALEDATEAQTGAADENAQLYAAMYGDAVGRSKGDYIAGAQAQDLLMRSMEMDTDAYRDASNEIAANWDSFGGLGSGLGDSAGNGLPTNLPTPDGSTHRSTTSGLGTPSLMYKTVGHNPSLSAAIKDGNVSNAAWWANGGPSVAGSATANGLFKTVTGRTPAEILGFDRGIEDQASPYGAPADNYAAFGGNDWSRYMEDNPDLQKAYDTLGDRSETAQRWWTESYDFNQNGELDPEEYGFGHYQEHGQNAGRKVHALDSAAAAPGDTSGVGTAGVSTTGNDIFAGQDENWWDTFTSSGDYLTTAALNDQNINQLNSSAAAGGQALSGAQQLAITNRLKVNENAAYNDWKNGLSSVAGLSQTASNTANSASSNLVNGLTTANDNSANAWSQLALNQQDAAANALTSGINTGVNAWLNQRQA